MSRNMNLSGIVTIILGAMYVGAMAMVVFLIMVQLQSRKRMPRTFASLLRVKLGVLGLSWDFWAKSVSELQLEVEQIQLDAIGDGCSDRWRVCRWPDSTEQAVTWLMGIFISLALRGRRWRRRNEMRFFSYLLARPILPLWRLTGAMAPDQIETRSGINRNNARWLNMDFGLASFFFSKKKPIKLAFF